MIKPLQSVLQRAFLRVEALFNSAFGDRLNPLYHLGSITFFLFWVVCGSGLYLYAFFETGVADAFASVEALTHRQWFAGGILRSVHRYASDAFVLTMLLHLLRHFAFDRFRAWRWFSWVSGVALVWGVYVSSSPASSGSTGCRASAAR
jgi:CDP-4-dehydro-6-deoxyglucose reductase, E3